MALQKIGATGEKLKNVGSSIEGVGKKLMPVTAAVGGLGAAAVKVAADFDSGMSQVAAVSGATGKELDALREKAREMGAKTKFSASEAAEAMNYMAMAGWKTGDMLDSNVKADFRSYFLSFDTGARLEIMNKPVMEDCDKTLSRTGLIHIAFSVGSKEKVNELTARLKADGYEIVSGPRTIGDGYYESCIIGIEGNQIELTNWITFRLRMSE